MEVANTPETSVKFYQTTQRYNLEARHFRIILNDHSYLCNQNNKFYQGDYNISCYKWYPDTNISKAFFMAHHMCQSWTELAPVNCPSYIILPSTVKFAPMPATITFTQQSDQLIRFFLFMLWREQRLISWHGMCTRGGVGSTNEHRFPDGVGLMPSPQRPDRLWGPTRVSCNCIEFSLLVSEAPEKTSL